MFCIQNSSIGTPTPFNKATAGFTGILSITLIALSLIGLSATASGPLHAMVQFGQTTKGFLLGTSIFVLIFDLVWIAALSKKTKEPCVARPGPSQLEPSRLSLPNPESLEQKSAQSTLVPATEEINNTDYLSQQPQEMILEIFSYLSAIELAKCDAVSRRWRRLASHETLLAAFNPRNLSPLIKVFDESDWVNHVDMSAYGLDLGDIPPYEARKTAALLQRVLSSPFMTEIEKDAGITLLTIPKGLTLNKLVKLAGTHKVGNPIKFRYIENPISNVIGDIPVDKTYRIVITNSIFKGSRKLSSIDHKSLVKEIGCEMPKVLEATVLLVVTFMSSGERLYNDNQWIYTRCSEQFGTGQLIVGGFSSDGILVKYGYRFFVDGNGVGGVLRKF